MSDVTTNKQKESKVGGLWRYVSLACNFYTDSPDRIISHGSKAKKVDLKDGRIYYS